MNNETNHTIKYPATMHYEWHPTKEGVYAIHVRFPDLLAIGLHASTVGNDPEDAIVAAKEILGIMVDYATERGISLPKPTPLEKLSINRSFDDLPEPFRIVSEYISLGSV